MKVLLLANNEYTVYGFRRELVDKLLSLGCETHISFPVGEYTPYFLEKGCRVHNLSISQHGMNPVKDISLAFQYIRLIKEVEPDFVLTYTIKPNVYGGFVCGLLKKHYVSTITGLGAAFEKNGLMTRLALFLYKMGLRKADAVFFQNKNHSELFNENNIAEGKHKLVSGSGVNLDIHTFEEYPPNGKTSFLFVGRIMKDKGIYELVEAFKSALKVNPDIELKVVGPADEADEAKIKDFEKQGILTYYGKQSDVHKFIKDAHAVILPSYHEGMANVLLEAGACGRPVIASDIPGCRETFEEDFNGFGVEPKSAESLSNAINKFLSLPYEQKRQMGINGRKKIENEFDRSVVVDAYISTVNKYGDK